MVGRSVISAYTASGAAVIVIEAWAEAGPSGVMRRSYRGFGASGSVFGLRLEAIQGLLDVLGVGGRAIVDAGGLLRGLAEPVWPSVPGLLGDTAATVDGCDVVTPVRDRDDGAVGVDDVHDVEGEHSARFGMGDRALGRPLLAATVVVALEHRAGLGGVAPLPFHGVGLRGQGRHGREIGDQGIYVAAAGGDRHRSLGRRWTG